MPFQWAGSSVLTHTYLDGSNLRDDVCTQINTLMVCSLHKSAESEYATMERFYWKNLCISRKNCLCILKNTTAVAVPLVAVLSELSFNLQTHTFYFFPSSSVSSTQNLWLLTTELLFLVTLLGPLRWGLWPPGAQGYIRTHDSRLHAPEKSSVSIKGLEGWLSNTTV